MLKERKKKKTIQEVDGGKRIEGNIWGMGGW